MVFVPFIKLCCMICQQESFDVHRPHNHTVIAAIISQQIFCGEFLLRGYLAKEWLAAIMRFDWDKPEQWLSHLYKGLWKLIFEVHPQNSSSGCCRHIALPTVNIYNRASSGLVEWYPGGSFDQSLDLFNPAVRGLSTSSCKELTQMLIIPGAFF